MTTVSLYCFPCAGGTGTVNYSRWRQEISQLYRIEPIDFPGRGKRMAEQSIPSFRNLALDLFENIKSTLPHRYILFGHSFGGLLAYECAHILQGTSHQQPLALIVACTAAPSMVKTEDYNRDWTAEAVLEKMRALGGTPSEIYQHPEILQMLVEQFRLDLLALKTFRYNKARPKLSIPIFVIGGTNDEITPIELASWGTMTTSNSSIAMFKGGHFVPTENSRDILKYIDMVVRDIAR